MKIIQALLACIFFLFYSNFLHAQLWKQLADSAKLYSDRMNVEKAIDFAFKERDELQKDSIGSLTYAQLCFSLGVAMYRTQRFDDAEKLYIESKQIREKVLGKEHPDYASSCNNLADIYEDRKQYGKAEPLYLESKQIRAKTLGKEHPEYASSCNNLAILYMDMGLYEKSEQQYLEAKSIREKTPGKESREYANNCDNLSILYRLMGQNFKALEFGKEGMQIRARVLGKYHPSFGASCYNLATIYFSMGEYDSAEAYYQTAKQIKEKAFGKKSPSYAMVCNSIALLYTETGAYGKAEPLYQEAIHIQEKATGKENPSYAMFCNNLGSLYLNMGQFKNAEMQYKEAKDIQEKVSGKEHPNYAGNCDNLARVYVCMDSPDKAETLYLEAKQVQEKVLGKEHPEYAKSCNSLANLYEMKGQYDKAEPLYAEAKNIRAKLLGTQHVDYAQSCTGLGTLYKDQGQFDKAETLYIEAKQIWGKAVGTQNPSYAISCDDLANLYWLMHKPGQAMKEFAESFSIKSNNLYSIFQFTNEKEKYDYIKNVSGEDDIAYSFYLSEKIKSDQPYSLALFHRNLILYSSQEFRKQLFYSKDSVLINKYKEWNDLRNYLAVLYSKPIDKRKEDFSETKEKADRLEEELTRLSATFKKQQENVRWKDIQNKLMPNEAAIEFTSFNFYNGKRWSDSTFYIALILTKDKKEAELVPLFETKQLDSILNESGNVAADNKINNLYAGNSALYNLIWKPMEKSLKGITKIYFAPSGNLHKIAFAALLIDNNKVLSDKYRLTELSTTSVITDQVASYIDSTDNIKLYGGVKYDADSASLKQAADVYALNKDTASTVTRFNNQDRGSKFNYLPGTETEIEYIKNQAQKINNHVIALSGVNATEESFKALNGKASPAVIHIATHGFFFPDPKLEKDKTLAVFETSGRVFKQSDDPFFRSGLLFAGANNAWAGKPIEGIEDGILTSYEVSDMYLPNTKLVVLSACETALGDIRGSEGVYGLQRAFKIAGAKNLVMSLWKVPDQETAEFMQLFYDNLFSRQSVSDAFFHAQTKMKNKYRSEPYKWAAWILIR